MCNIVKVYIKTINTSVNRIVQFFAIRYNKLKYSFHINHKPFTFPIHCFA